VNNTLWQYHAATTRITLFASLILATAGAGPIVEKPADLPESYRDFAIYTTSSPDPADDARIAYGQNIRPRPKLPYPTGLRRSFVCHFSRLISLSSTRSWTISKR